MSFPVSKRIQPGSVAARHSKKAYTPSLHENVAEQSFDGGAKFVKLSDGIDSSSFVNDGSTVEVSGDARVLSEEVSGAVQVLGKF